MKRITADAALAATMVMAQTAQTNQTNQIAQTNPAVQAAAGGSVVDNAVAATNAIALGHLVQKGVLSYSDALSKAEAAGWSLPYLVQMTRYSSNNVTAQQISAMLSRVDFASIDDTSYMTYVCEMMNVGNFCKTQEGQVFQTALEVARPAWAVVTSAGRTPRAFQAALAAYKTDKCSGCNILLIARYLSMIGGDIMTVYRQDIWDSIPSNCLFTYGAYYNLPHHKAGEPAAVVMSDWIAACWKNGIFSAYIAQKNLDNILNIVDKIDGIRGNRNAASNMFEKMTQPGFVGKSINERFLFALVCRTGNSEWMLDRIIETNGNLLPEDLEAFIKVVGGLDIDYQPAKVIKALKTVNQRYTLKLYEDREKWEPILSKIRALIDVRS